MAGFLNIIGELKGIVLEFKIWKFIKKLLNLTKPQFKEEAEWGSFGNGLEWDK